MEPAVPEGRLLATVVFQPAQQDVYPPDRAVEYGLSNPGDSAGIPNVDNGCPMLRGSPGAQFSVNDLQNLEAGKNPVICLGPKDKIEFRFDRQLRDFRRTERSHAASPDAALTISTKQPTKGSTWAYAAGAGNKTHRAALQAAQQRNG
jgi:hypothetical protein